MMIQSLDARLLLFVNHETANGFFDVLMPALSLSGYLLVIPFLLATLLWAAKRKRETGRTYLPAAIAALLIASSAVFLAEVTESLLKEAIARPRPCRVIEGIRLIIACPRSFSMPSGHAISSFAFVLPLYYLTRDYVAAHWRLYPLLLAGAIAFSRIYLGVHYPTDVLAGTILGIGIGMGLSLLYETAAGKIVKRKTG